MVVGATAVRSVIATEGQVGGQRVEDILVGLVQVLEGRKVDGETEADPVHQMRAS